MLRDEVIAKLNSLAEADYKEFNQKITPTKKEVLGVRLPALRKLAKEIVKEDWQSFLNTSQDEIFEELMLQGFVIGYAKLDLPDRFRYIESFVPKIDNWAICDSFCGTLKFASKCKSEVWDFLQDYLQAEEEFQVRFAVVMLMNYFLDDEHIEEVLKIYDSIKSDKYYVQMGVAWAISVCFVKYQELTMDYLKNNNLDDFTYNKSLQKIIESLRVDKETKDIIRSMKRK